MTDDASIKTVSISSDAAAIAAQLELDLPSDQQEIIQSDRYLVGNLIGKGGMGLVYHAYDEAFDREVALKVLLRDYQSRDESRNRFFQEARTTAKLQHPGIVSVYDMGLSDDGQPYFAMKLVRGTTLRDLLKNENDTPLQRSRLLDVFSRVCQSVAYAHARKTVHLDIKPSNVMVGAYGEVYLMDWGLSRQLGETPIQLTPISPRGGGFDFRRRTLDAVEQ